MEPSKHTRLVTAFLLVLVFGTGVVVGVAVDRGVRTNPSSEDESGQMADARGDDRDDDRRERRRPMYERVGELSESQERSIDSIVKHHRESMRALQEEFEAEYDPRYRAIIDSTRGAIMAVMTPEQAQRYDSLLTAWDRRRDERRRQEEASDRDRR